MIEIMYTIAGSIAVIASSPQVVQLVRAGHSSEMSIVTWGMWCVTQTVSLMYTIALQLPLLIFFNFMWVLFYLTMTSLILYYRKYPRIPALEVVEVQSDA